MNQSFYDLGIVYADKYWKGNDRFPLTTLRKLLRMTRTSKEWIDAKQGFYKRLRDHSKMSLDELNNLA